MSTLKNKAQQLIDSIESTNAEIEKHRQQKTKCTDEREKLKTDSGDPVTLAGKMTALESQVSTANNAIEILNGRLEALKVEGRQIESDLKTQRFDRQASVEQQNLKAMEDFVYSPETKLAAIRLKAAFEIDNLRTKHTAITTRIGHAPIHTPEFSEWLESQGWDQIKKESCSDLPTLKEVQQSPDRLELTLTAAVQG